MRAHITLSFLALAMAAAPSAVLEQAGTGPQRDRAHVHQPADEGDEDAPIFGHQLMTSEEMAEHRARMRAATTAQERERIRTEHHAQMLERARQRGVTLPEEPPARGMGGGRGPMPDDRPRKGRGPGGG